MDKPYYFAYENRYQKVFEAGIKCWGHSPEDEAFLFILEGWVAQNDLTGKRVIEFACGEGACGVILSKLGCSYRGVDIAPSAVEKARDRLKDFPDAQISVLDMVKETVNETYDAAIDCMGLHMLVTEHEREAYLQNAFHALKPGAPMLFFRESYRENAYDGVCNTFEQWKEISGEDYETPGVRYGQGKGEKIKVHIPLVPARAKNKEGYLKEMKSVGFLVEDFIEMDQNNNHPYSASIYVRKP